MDAFIPALIGLCINVVPNQKHYNPACLQIAEIAARIVSDGLFAPVDRILTIETRPDAWGSYGELTNDGWDG